MDQISDLALDLGEFELDNELESGMERSQRTPVELVLQEAGMSREKIVRDSTKAKRKR